MELVDLPGRERVGLNERRKAVGLKAQAQATTQRDRDRDNRDVEMVDGLETQTQTQGRRNVKDPVLSAQSWILVSCLPAPYRARPALMVPSRAPDQAVESAYVALYTMVVALMYLHTPSGGGGAEAARGEDDDGSGTSTTEPISDAKLHRYLSRLNLSEWTPMGVEGANVDKLLARMVREGYVEKRRETSGGEEVVEWVVGPRGRREVGRKGVAGLVRGVYGFGVDGSGLGLEMPRADDGDEQEEGEQHARKRRPVKMEKDELEARLKRTLGDGVALRGQQQNGAADPGDEHDENRRELNADADERNGPRRSGRRRRDHDDEANG